MAPTGVVVTLGRRGRRAESSTRCRPGARGAGATSSPTHLRRARAATRRVAPSSCARDATPTVGCSCSWPRPDVRTAEVSTDCARSTLDGTVTRTPGSRSPLTDGAGCRRPARRTARPHAGAGRWLRRTAARLIGPAADGRPGRRRAICRNCTGEDFLDQAPSGPRATASPAPSGSPGSRCRPPRYFNGPVDPAVAERLGLGVERPQRADGHALYVGLTRLPGGQVLRTAQSWPSTDATARRAAMTLERRPSRSTRRRRRPAPFVLSAQTADGTTRRAYQVFAPGAAQVQLVSDAAEPLPGHREGARASTAPPSCTTPLRPTSERRLPGRRPSTPSGDADRHLAGRACPNRDDPYDVRP